jgi:diguanylate cyclase (GGDEF)-like protein
VKIREIKSALEEFRQSLKEHEELWGKSLGQPLPGYPVTNNEALKAQSQWLSRQLGALRPFIIRFEPEWNMQNPATGIVLDALDAATGLTAIAQIKGPALEAVSQKIDQVIGRLETLNLGDEVPEDPTKPIQGDSDGEATLRDHVTQLLNREAFDAALDRRISDCAKSGQPISLIMGDVDHFKKVNDTYGHPAGDTVLVEISARLKAVLHGKAPVYRYGGEEIAVILPNRTAEEALAAAERCRREIEKNQIGAIAVTMSFGVACIPGHASDAAGLIASADKALYEAKEYGRNLVRQAGEPPPAAPGPRVPDRKVAVAGGLTESQRIELRRRLLRHEKIECPYDGAFFNVIDNTGLGDNVKHYHINCPGCGLADEL